MAKRKQEKINRELKWKKDKSRLEKELSEVTERQKRERLQNTSELNAKMAEMRSVQRKKKEFENTLKEKEKEVRMYGFIMNFFSFSYYENSVPNDTFFF